MRSKYVRLVAGFTLIEVMVAVAVVAILAAIAFPSYSAYVIRGHRAAVKTQMMDMAAREQQFLLANRRYAADIDELNFTLPSEVAERYECEVEPNEEGDAPSFEITCVGIGAQISDGVLILDNVGNKTPLEKWQK